MTYWRGVRVVACSRSAIAVTALVSLRALPAAQTTQPEQTLATIRITQSVMADGKPLPEGTYQLVLTDERPTPLTGQSPDAEQWVALVADGKVVAREVVEVLRDDALPSVGASARPTSDVRIELLRGGEFLRISVKRGGQRYLLHLPVSR